MRLCLKYRSMQFLHKMRMYRVLFTKVLYITIQSITGISSQPCFSLRLCIHFNLPALIFLKFSPVTERSLD